jgi:hypothetical protein
VAKTFAAGETKQIKPMEVLKKLWLLIKDFFSPSKKDWEEFNKKKEKQDGVGYDTEIDTSSFD